MLVMRRTALVILLALITPIALPPVPITAQQTASTADPFHRALDQILDLNVRDGMVY